MPNIRKQMSVNSHILTSFFVRINIFQASLTDSYYILCFDLKKFLGYSYFLIKFGNRMLKKLFSVLRQDLSLKMILRFF